MTASGREHPKGCESKYSTYLQIPYQQSTRIQLHVPKRTPAGAPPGGAALPFMSPTTRTLSILTGPHPRGRPRSPRQAAVRSSARRPSPRAGRGPPALAQASRPCASSCWHGRWKASPRPPRGGSFHRVGSFFSRIKEFINLAPHGRWKARELEADKIYFLLEGECLLACRVNRVVRPPFLVKFFFFRAKILTRSA